MSAAANPTRFIVRSDENPRLILCMDGGFHAEGQVGPGGWCARVYRSHAHGLCSRRAAVWLHDPPRVVSFGALADPKMPVTSESINTALSAAILSLNAANDAVDYAEMAMRKAKEAQTEAKKAVDQLSQLVQTAWQAEQAAAKAAAGQ